MLTLCYCRGKARAAVLDWKKNIEIQLARNMSVSGCLGLPNCRLSLVEIDKIPRYWKLQAKLGGSQAHRRRSAEFGEIRWMCQ